MDRNPWHAHIIQGKIEEWRERRVEKMASRLQMNSNEPRAISSSVLGCGNYWQQETVEPNHRLAEGENYYAHNRPEQRWNSNFNYSSYREHNLSRNQRQQDYNVDHRAHDSFHHHRQRKTQFSNQKSLISDRKIHPKFISRKYSNYNNFKSNKEVRNQDSLLPTNHKTNISNKKCTSESNLAIATNSLQSNIDIVQSSAASGSLEDSCSNSDPNNDLSCHIPSTDLYKYESISPQSKDENISSAMNLLEADIVENLDLKPQEEELKNPNLVDPKSNETPTDNAVIVENTFENERIKNEMIEHKEVTIIANQPKQNLTTSENDVNNALALSQFENANVDNKSLEVICEETFFDGSCKKLYLNEVLDSTIDNKPEDGDIKDPKEELKVDNFFISDLNTTSDIYYDVANETLDLDLKLNYEPEVEVVVEDSTYEPSIDSGLMFDHDTSIVAVPSSEELSVISEIDKGNIEDEMESVGDKLANISIAGNKTEIECKTPMKREKQHVLLDATNILPSSTIKYAVREIRKNDETEIIVTPVRRSLRMSCITPTLKQKICVDKIEELSPEVLHKMKFVPNPAIYHDSSSANNI